MTDTLQRLRPRVALDAEGWPERALAELGTTGTVTAVVPHSRNALAAEFCAFLAGRAVESDYLLVFARIRAIRFEDDRIEIDAEVAEGAT